MVNLRADSQRFEEANAQVLGISADSRHALNQFASGLGRLSFPLLADFYPHGQVADSGSRGGDDYRGIHPEQSVWAYDAITNDCRGK